MVTDVSSQSAPSFVTFHHRSTCRGFVQKLDERCQLAMIEIPAGDFLMGAPDSEDQSKANEKPPHRVHVQRFFCGRTPVTQAQWRFVAGLPEGDRPLNPDPSHFKGDDRPVEYVSWLDAVEFCQRLSVYTQREYRLPTEAEWEYACRAGTQTPFHFGKTLTPDLANYNAQQSYANSSTGLYREETTPVDSFGVANAFGLSNMHGNVWEWCEDHWHDNYEGAPPDGSAWVDDRDRQNTAGRLLRGGSWSSDPGDCRSACRNDFNAGVEYVNFGFRVVCSVVRTP